MIQLKDVSCGYGKKCVLSNVNIEVEAGTLTCLLGKNGAGKTTLFKTLLGLLPPMCGDIYVNQKPLKKASPKELARIISYVPQAHGTPFPFSALEVVLMGQYAHSSGMFAGPSKKDKKKAGFCLEMLGIDYLKNKSFSRLSGGEKQMVLIARAIAQEPLFIAMDEPTSNLDVGNQNKVMRIASQLKQKGYGVIMNTHSPDQALRYADRVMLLKDGKACNSGAVRDNINAEILSGVYDAPIEIVNARLSDGRIIPVCVSGE